jgi:hypothetical protein
MKNEKFCSPLSTCFKRNIVEGLEQEDFQTVLRAAGETETTQEISKIGFSCMMESLDFIF